MHIALAGETSALPSAAVALPGSTAAQESIGMAEDVPIEIAGDARADAVAAVEELEVEIRNQADTPAATRDLMANILRLIRENLARMAPDQLGRAATLIRENVSSDYLDPDFWRGVGMVLQYQIDEITSLIQRRRRGEYTTRCLRHGRRAGRAGAAVQRLYVPQLFPRQRRQGSITCRARAARCWLPIIPACCRGMA